MSILLAIMIPSPFTRLVTTNVTIAVVILHGVTVWAVMSMDSSRPIEPVNIPKSIQIELIEASSLSKESPTDIRIAEFQSTPTESIVSEQTLAKLTETSKPIKSPKSIAVSKPIKPIEQQVEEQPFVPVKSKMPTKTLPKKLSSNKTPPNQTVSDEQPSKDVLTKPNITSSTQSLTTVESRKVVRSSSDESEVEDDLSAMIRAVTAQFNREQAIQKRHATSQAGKKQMDREQWQAQAASETIEKMLVLAAAQAEQQNSEQADLDNEMDNTEATVFKADYGSWIEGSEPTTSVPSLVWSNVNTNLGDVFIVMLELHVDKEGYIIEVQLLESSGSPIIDAIATTQVRDGQLIPLKDNGIAVDAIVPMSLVYERP